MHKISNKPKQFQRATQFKIYLTNPSLRSALFAPLQLHDPFIGNMVETAIYAQWLHREWFTPYYARWQKREVDMVKLDERKLQPQWAVEIKWSNKYFENPGELKALIQFLNDNDLKTALVTTIDKEGIKEINGLTFFFVPAAVYAFTVGKNTLLQKHSRNA